MTRPEALEAVVRRLIDLGQWQRYTLVVEKLDVSALAGDRTFYATGMVDVTVRLHVPPSLIPSDLVTPENE